MEEILIGNKNMATYITVTLSAVSRTGKAKLLARGLNINKAVNVANILKNKFNVKIGNVVIGTDKLKTDDGKEINKSFIEIDISK